MARERVQVQGLGDAVPGIQPTIQRGGQYAVQVQRAGRNKLMDLADALSQVNPILSEFGNIRRIQREQQQAFEKAMLAEGEKAFQLDPTGMTAQLQSFEKQARSLAEKGELPEEANAIRMIGAMRAKAQVLANRDYRATLLNPELLQQTTDPEVAILKQREQFLQREELQSPLVRDSVLEHLFKVEDEFRNKVQDRLDQIDIEDGRRNWLELGRDSIKQAIVGELDINDPSVVNWINHPAGIFKGSRKFAWDNLIKEDLKEGLTTGDYTPTEVLDFVEDLRELDLGGGIKFADADTGNAITDFIDYVNNKAAVYESKANAKINEEYELAMSSSIQVFLNEWSEDGSISEDTFKNEANRLASLVPPSKTNTYLLDLRKQFSNLNKAKDDSTNITYSNRILELEQGKDLDELKNQLLKDVTQGAITQPQFAELNSKLESYRDFNNNFIKTDTYRTLSNGYEEVILGFRADLGWDSSKIQNHFERIGSVGGEATYEKDDHLYGRIKKEKGESAAKIYLNNRYSVFKKEFKESLKSKFDGYLEDGKSVAEARNLLINEAVQVGTDIFEKWSQDSITLATQLYGI